MIGRVIFTLSLCALSVAAVGDRGARFVLPPQQGGALLRQCSRPAPQGITGFWVPTDQEIAELEKRLVPFLKSRPAGAALLPLARYHRQYVGLIKNGERYIYGNFYVPSAGVVSEGSRPVVVCDGGKSFWGVVYSVETKSFSALRFNGAA